MKDASEYLEPLPGVSDPVAGAVWTATKEHKLEMPSCRACQHVVWPPARACPDCLSPNVELAPVAPGGTIWSFAIYHRALHPERENDVPYNLALVKMDAGPVVYGSILAPDDQLTIGARVTATFDDADPEAPLVKWRLASA